MKSGMRKRGTTLSNMENFTLIELLVVIAIIAILGGYVIAGFKQGSCCGAEY